MTRLGPGEWARHPHSLAVEAYFDGWNQAVGHSPISYPRFLNEAEYREWRLGWADGKKAGPPPHDPGELKPREDAPRQEHPTQQPIRVLAPEPLAPHFDGTQACAETDPEAFFPEKGGSVRAAKAVCGRCEFQEPCLEYALDAAYAGSPVSGIWGGTSEGERRRIRAERRGAA